MTNQELFDKVLAHARKQNARALEFGRCAYRAPEGLMCFAGALIADEHYDSSFEGIGANFTRIKRALIASGIAKEQLDLVAELQAVHDRHLVPEWPAEFAKVATHYKLAYENNPT
jgi:hypothetical protein